MLPLVYMLSLPGWKVNNELITLPQVQYRTECVQTLLSCASQVKLLIYTPNPFEFVHFCLFLGSCSLMASFSLRKPHFPLPQRVDARDFWYSEKPSHFLRDCSLGFLLSWMGLFRGFLRIKRIAELPDASQCAWHREGTQKMFVEWITQAFQT